MTLSLNRITCDYFASSQITPVQISEIKAEGFDLVINNRPDGEAPDQPTHQEMQLAAEEAGIAYIFIPIGPAGISTDDLDAFDKATSNSKKTLGFCRTGTRSTIVRSMAAARAGQAIDDIIEEAGSGGYDLCGHRPQLESLAPRSAS